MRISTPHTSAQFELAPIYKTLCHVNNCGAQYIVASSTIIHYLLLMISTFLMRVHKLYEMHLRTTHCQLKLIDAGPRIRSTCTRARRSSKNASSTSWPSIAQCVYKIIMPCLKNTPSQIRMFSAFTRLYKSTNISCMRNKILPLMYTTLLPNFQKLSRTFGILLNTQKFYYAWVLLRT